jgi:DNA-binding LytR/AlgR family response regulator
MRIVIVEDEVMVARRLERLVREAAGVPVTIAVAHAIDQAAALLAGAAEAVVLLDLNLSGEDGFDLLRRAAAEPFQVIVVSASTDRAIEAFELGVVDFVPKPFSRERLSVALERARARRGAAAARFLAIADTGGIDLVPLDQVVAIRGADDYSEVETADGRTLLHKKTLAALEGTLPADFLRVHRSHIVNLHYAARLVSHGGGRHELVLTRGRSAPVGRGHVDALRKRLG